MNTYYSDRSSRPARLFPFGLLDGPQIRLRGPHLREAMAGFGLNRFATAFMNIPGYVPNSLDRFVAASTAEISVARNCLASNCSMPAMVVPAGEVIRSFNRPGCSPLSKNIRAEPSTV